MCVTRGERGARSTISSPLSFSFSRSFSPETGLQNCVKINHFTLSVCPLFSSFIFLSLYLVLCVLACFFSIHHFNTSMLFSKGSVYETTLEYRTKCYINPSVIYFNNMDRILRQTLTLPCRFNQCVVKSSVIKWLI